MQLEWLIQIAVRMAHSNSSFPVDHFIQTKLAVNLFSIISRISVTP